jgi:hypothetical protein
LFQLAERDVQWARQVAEAVFILGAYIKDLQRRPRVAARSKSGDSGARRTVFKIREFV